MANTSETAGYLTPTNATPPVADNALEDALNHIVRGLTGLPGQMVRPRWLPEPLAIPPASTDWAAIGVLTIAPMGGEGALPYIEHVPVDPDEDEVDDDHQDVMETHDDVAIIATFYGPNCGRLSRRFRAGLFAPQAFEEYEGIGIGLVDAGPIRFLPELVNDTWYKRVDVEFTLRMRADYAYAVQNIREAQGIVNATTQGDVVIEQEWDTNLVQPVEPLP